jgi:hygromycin-B 7''-O-kinase
MTAVLRAHHALQEAGLTGVGRLTRAANSTNEVWFIGPYVLRINPVVDQAILVHERNVLQALCSSVRAPKLVGYGQGDLGEWLVVERLPGEELGRRWMTMAVDDREVAITALGHALRHLHATDPVAHGLDRAPFITSLHCPHQLPVERLLERCIEASRLAFVDKGLIAEVVGVVTANADAIDDHPSSLVHGDIHFENVLWDGTTVGLLDFEFARPGPADLDLDILLHSLAEPDMHLGADYTAPKRADFERVPEWLRAAYPELFSHPRFADRMVVYRLAFEIRALIASPPDRPVSQLPVHHPYIRLERVVQGRSDLGWVLAP